MGSAGWIDSFTWSVRHSAHQQLALFDPASPWAPNTLTFVDGQWAYCPAGERNGHEWRETEARPYADVRDEVEERIRSRL